MNNQQFGHPEDAWEAGGTWKCEYGGCDNPAIEKCDTKHGDMYCCKEHISCVDEDDPLEDDELNEDD